jgi:hypothetical protein
MHQPKYSKSLVRDNLIDLEKPVEVTPMTAWSRTDRLRFIGLVSGFTKPEMTAFAADPEGFLDGIMPDFGITYTEDPFVIEALARADDIFGKLEDSDEAESSDEATPSLAA